MILDMKIFIIVLAHFFAFIFLSIPNYSQSQTTSINLSFSAVHNYDFQQLDSIIIINLSQEGDTTLHYPDTILQIEMITSIPLVDKIDERTFKLEQNIPNPFKSITSINLHLYKNESITVRVTDPSGKSAVYFNGNLEKGGHNFRFIPGDENYYVLTVFGKLQIESIKMLVSSQSNNSRCKLNYIGHSNNSFMQKFQSLKNDFTFSSGDELMFIGYVDGIESALTGNPENNQFIEFQFATNIPCPGTPTVFYGDQEYNTIQVYSQCWMKESLNYETENSWCIDDNPDYCDEYGRLYLWESTIDLCPPSWHVPSDNEWRIIEGVTDSLYGIQDPVWTQSGGWRGENTGSNLKSNTGWFAGGNGVDQFGFTAKPGGYQLPNGNNGAATIEVGFWTSTEYDNETAWQRFLQFSQIGVYRYPFEKEWGLYVRCIKD